MKIEKFKKLNKGKYKVYFTDNNEYILYENIILKYNLLSKKEINLKTLDEIIKDNELEEAYDLSLNYISYKLRTPEEIRKNLEKKEIKEENIIKTIERLKNENYLNENKYVYAYITDKVNLSNIGPNKIKQELLKNKIDENLIDEELNNIDKEIWKEKIEKFISKKIKLNKKLSNTALKKKIKQDLINLGYDYYLIEELLVIDEEENKEILLKEFTKLYNKYSKKLNKVNLKYKLKNEMYKKGFKEINIEELINEIK